MIKGTDEGFGSWTKRTYREDGSLATVIDGTRLIQYNREGEVSFVEKLDYDTKVTYRDGQVAAIEKSTFPGRTVTLYDDSGHVTTDIALNKDDQVNFKDGYLSSVVKHSGSLLKGELVETQYGQSGKILAVTHKSRVGDVSVGGGMWVTTSHSTYHDNGKLATVQTYKQKHKKNGFLGSNLQEEADSYLSSVEQYDENGKIVVTLKLNEKDEVNYSGNKIVSLVRRDNDGNPTSSTMYNTDGSIANITNYKDGKVISSIDYENGHPVRGRQEGTENYQDIFGGQSEINSNKEIDAGEKIVLLQNNKIQTQANASSEKAEAGLNQLSEKVQDENNTPLTLISIAQTSEHIGQKYPQLQPQEIDVLSGVVKHQKADNEVANIVSDIANDINKRNVQENNFNLDKKFVIALIAQIELLRQEVEVLRKRIDNQQQHSTFSQMGEYVDYEEVSDTMSDSSKRRFQSKYGVFTPEEISSIVSSSKYKGR